MARLSWVSMAAAFLVIVTLLLCLSMGHGGPSLHNATLFIDLESFLLVAFPAFGLLLFTHGLKTFRFLMDCVKAPFIKQDAPSPVNAEMAKDATLYVLSSGVFGCIVGFIKMLATLDDPSKIGAGMAVSLLSILYTTIGGGFIFMPLSKKFLTGKQSLSLPSPSTGGLIFIPVLGLAFILTVVIFLIISSLFNSHINEQARVQPMDGIQIVSAPDGSAEIVFRGFQGNLHSTTGKRDDLRYIKVDIVIDARGKEAETFFRNFANKIRGIIVSEVLSTSSEDGATSGGREGLEKRILQKLKEIAPKDISIDALYFSNYLVS